MEKYNALNEYKLRRMEDVLVDPYEIRVLNGPTTMAVMPSLKEHDISLTDAINEHDCKGTNLTSLIRLYQKAQNNGVDFNGLNLSNIDLDKDLKVDMNKIRLVDGKIFDFLNQGKKSDLTYQILSMENASTFSEPQLNGLLKSMVQNNACKSYIMLPSLKIGNDVISDLHQKIPRDLDLRKSIIY